MSEEYKLTQRGVEEALGILERDGYLPEATDEEAMNTILLRDACKKFVEASAAKGDARSDEENEEAVTIGFFQAHLEARVRRLVN